MDYNYIHHTINCVPLDVYVSQDYQSVWLSSIDMSCLFAVDVEEIEEYIDKLLELGVIENKDYNEEKSLYSLTIIALIGANFKSPNLKPFVNWAINLMKAYKVSKNVNDDKMAYLISNIIDIENRVDHLCGETRT